MAMNKKSVGVVTEYFYKEDRRPIDRIMDWFFRRNIIEFGRDMIGIIDSNGACVGGFYGIRGPRLIVKWLERASDCKGKGHDVHIFLNNNDLTVSR